MHGVKTIIALFLDLATFLWLTLRPQSTLAAENLFLREQLAMLQDRKAKPHRPDTPVRITLVLLDTGTRIKRTWSGHTTYSASWLQIQDAQRRQGKIKRMIFTLCGYRHALNAAGIAKAGAAVTFGVAVQKLKPAAAPWYAHDVILAR
jgi:hypothetical protein